MAQPVAGTVIGPSRRERFHAAEARIRRFTRLLDDLVPIPGTSQRVGVDPIVGLIPIVGDVIGALAGSWIVGEAAKFGIPRVVLARMLLNVLVDLALGMIPILGIAFDVVSRSNHANLELFRRHALDPDATTANHWAFFAGLGLVLLGSIWLVVALMLRVFDAFWGLLLG